MIYPPVEFLSLNCLLQLLSMPLILSYSASSIPANAVDVGRFVCPVSVNEPDYELSAHSLVTRETVKKVFTFPASVLAAVNALSVLSVSDFSRSQSLPWSPDQSSSPWVSSAPSALPWWSSARPWWAPVPSAPL